MTTAGDGAGLLRVSETLYRHLQARGGPDLLNVHAKWSPSAEITSKFEFQLQSGRNLSPATPSAPTFLMNPGRNSVLQGKKRGIREGFQFQAALGSSEGEKETCSVPLSRHTMY